MIVLKSTVFKFCHKAKMYRIRSSLKKESYAKVLRKEVSNRKTPLKVTEDVGYCPVFLSLNLKPH